jgi:aspartyl-tRNA synthetase
MEFSTNYRTKPMNEFSEADINSTVKIAGWVENIRDHGGVSFIDLRDMYGVMQVVMRDTTLLDGISKEDCLSIEGIVEKSIKFVFIIITYSLHSFCRCFAGNG